MIIKVAPGASSVYANDQRDLLELHEGEWHKCIYPHATGYVKIIIDDVPISILNRHIQQVVNEDRHLYDVCTQCGTTFLKDTDSCPVCMVNRSLGCLKPLLIAPLGSSAPGKEQILKGSIRNTFGI